MNQLPVSPKKALTILACIFAVVVVSCSIIVFLLAPGGGPALAAMAALARLLMIGSAVLVIGCVVMIFNLEKLSQFGKAPLTRLDKRDDKEG